MERSLKNLKKTKKGNILYTSKNGVKIKMKRVNMYLSERGIERLNAESERRDLSVSELVRRGIDVVYGSGSLGLLSTDDLYMYMERFFRERGRLVEGHKVVVGDFVHFLQVSTDIPDEDGGKE